MARPKKSDPELLLVSFCDILTISISALFMATIVTVFEATKIPELSMTPRTAATDKQAVFFECRSNEVFEVDLGRLQEQVEQALKTVDPGVRRGDMSQMIKVIQGRQITNRYYKVNATYLLTGMVALEPRPDVPGETLEQISQVNGKFLSVLQDLNPQKQYVAFLVRDDSFIAFRKAREIADKRGFDVGWELLGANEPIKFGASGSSLKVSG
jgi:hypothetical protein